MTLSQQFKHNMLVYPEKLKSIQNMIILLKKNLQWEIVKIINNTGLTLIDTNNNIRVIKKTIIDILFITTSLIIDYCYYYISYTRYRYISQILIWDDRKIQG